LTNVRREYTPCHEIVKELRRALEVSEPGQIDWVTFVGSGEPTLHSRLGKLIRQVKAMTERPVAVITNGALLYLPEIRSQLVTADAVLPSLDAGNPRLYRKINRPWPRLTFERLTEGLTAFRREYTGKLWVEVMLVQGLNDSEETLQDIAAVLERVRPDQVHINIPNRPPAEEWVQPSNEMGLMRALSILGSNARLVIPSDLDVQTGTSDDLAETIMGVITRHPMREKELIDLLERWSPNEVHSALDSLMTSGQAQVVERYGVRFWSPAGAHFQ